MMLVAQWRHKAPISTYFICGRIHKFRIAMEGFGRTVDFWNKEESSIGYVDGYFGHERPQVTLDLDLKIED